jgi:hypothetical protein
MAVHIGARIGAIAGSDEVLTSRTVRDLSAGSGLRFESLGLRHLKGLAEEAELFRDDTRYREPQRPRRPTISGATVADWWRRGTARLSDRSRRRCPYRRPARWWVTPRLPSMVLQQNASRCGRGCGVAPRRLRPRVADAVDLHRGGDARDDDYNRDGNRGNDIHRAGAAGPQLQQRQQYRGDE